MKHPTGKNLRPGVAILVVLFVIMAATLISLGFIARSDVELACGQNVGLRMQMDYLAQTGLVHAKALITNPQDADTAALGYWAGDGDLQIEAGDDYYDLTVARDDSDPADRCTYNIQSLAYRFHDAQKTAQSYLNARLRLDPCIAYWAGVDTTVSNTITVNGDVYCNGNLTNLGTINGDVFADSLTGPAEGKRYDIAEAGVNWPGFSISDFTPNYYIDSVAYTPQIFDPNDVLVNISFTPSAPNPAGVIVCNGNLTLLGNVAIDGTLIVDGDLTVLGANNTITPVKNFPALVVDSALSNGSLIIGTNGQLTVGGLLQTERMAVGNDAADITVLGALFVSNTGIEVIGGYSGFINITAAPMTASIKISPDSGTTVKWTPIGGAFFKSIRRE
jgi:hypothetical protein